MQNLRNPKTYVYTSPFEVLKETFNDEDIAIRYAKDGLTRIMIALIDTWEPDTNALDAAALLWLTYDEYDRSRKQMPIAG